MWRSFYHKADEGVPHGTGSKIVVPVINLPFFHVAVRWR
jgi:hypothetical protein